MSKAQKGKISWTQPRRHTGCKELKKINWLPTKERAEQSVPTKGTSLFYVNELFVPFQLRVTLGHIFLWRYLGEKIT